MVVFDPHPAFEEPGEAGQPVAGNDLDVETFDLCRSPVGVTEVGEEGPGSGTDEAGAVGPGEPADVTEVCELGDQQ